MSKAVDTNKTKERGSPALSHAMRCLAPLCLTWPSPALLDSIEPRQVAISHGNLIVSRIRKDVNA